MRNFKCFILQFVVSIFVKFIVLLCVVLTIRIDILAAFIHNKFLWSCEYKLHVSVVEAILRHLSTLFKTQNKTLIRFKIVF